MTQNLPACILAICLPLAAPLVALCADSISTIQSTSMMCTRWWFSREGFPQLAPLQSINSTSQIGVAYATGFAVDHQGFGMDMCFGDGIAVAGPGQTILREASIGLGGGGGAEGFLLSRNFPTPSQHSALAVRHKFGFCSETCYDPTTSTLSGAGGAGVFVNYNVASGSAIQFNISVSFSSNWDTSETPCGAEDRNCHVLDSYTDCSNQVAYTFACGVPSEVPPSDFPAYAPASSIHNAVSIHTLVGSVGDSSVAAGVVVLDDGSVVSLADVAIDTDGNAVITLPVPVGTALDVDLFTVSGEFVDWDFDSSGSLTCDDVFELARLVTQFGGAIDTLDDEDLVRRFNLDAGDGLEIVDAADVVLFQRIVEAFFEGEPCLFLDVNRDGVIDPCDVAYARAQSFVSTDADVRLDQNQDGAYDQDDLDLIIAGVLAEYGYIDGDVNGDFLVNLADFNIIALNFGMTGLPHGNGESRHLGDLNDDGKVDMADFNIMAVNSGSTGCP